MLAGAGAALALQSAYQAAGGVYGAYQTARTAYNAYSMVKNALKRRRTQAGKEERYLQKVDRAVNRYGPAAVAKYFVPGRDRTAGNYGRYLPGGELKYHDIPLSFLVDATAEIPTNGQFCLIPQGVTASQRVGRKCVVKSVYMKGIAFLNPGAAVTSSGSCWLYLMLDTQANGAAANITDIFTGPDLSTALMELEQGSRFRVLKKVRFTFNPTAGVSMAYNTNSRAFEVYKKCNVELEFLTGTGAITDLRTNNIFLVAGTDGRTDDLIQVTGSVRIRFADV